MTEHRWSKFWWQDYEGDDALRLCSLAAQGLWMRMLCAMHRGTPYGHISVNGAPPTERQLALMVSATEREVAKLVPELEQAGVLSRSADGLIFSRRMVRDKAITDKAREDGKTGGNPVLKQKGLTPPLNPKRPKPLKPEAEADTEAEEEAEKKDFNPSVSLPREAEAASPAPDPDPPWNPTAVAATVEVLAAKLEGRHRSTRLPGPLKPVRSVDEQLDALVPRAVKANHAPAALLAEARAKLRGVG